MGADIEIHGFCDEKFLRVKEAFTDNFEQGLEVGASLAVTLDGEFVVDLWGGYTSYSKKEAWGKDTIVCVFGTTRIMTALCALMLVDRGELELDAPVAKYWPEFAQAGKERLPVRYIFSNSAGLPGFDEIIPFEALYDWNRIVEMLARQKPWWEPGTATGYYDYTFGYLLGELVRRISGASIGEFFRVEVAEKIGADFHIGLPEKHHSRVAEPVNAVVSPKDVESDSIAVRTETSILPWPGVYASNEFRKAELSANGHGNARSTARVGSILAAGGELDGTHFLSRETIEKILEEQIYITDNVLGRPVRWGLGFGLPCEEHPLPNPNTLYWGGTGGSICIMDIDTKICVAYVMNQMNPGLFIFLDEPKNVTIKEALFACMEEM